MKLSLTSLPGGYCHCGVTAHAASLAIACALIRL